MGAGDSDYGTASTNSSGDMGSFSELSSPPLEFRKRTPADDLEAFWNAWHKWSNGLLSSSNNDAKSIGRDKYLGQ